MVLNDAKNYLKIDTDITQDDDYIQSLIDTTQIYIDSCVGEDYKTDDKLVKLATLAQYKLINDLYDNRSQYIDSNAKKDIIISTIFDKLANAGDTL